MQTFLPYQNPYKSAKVLDLRRLGKQRLECVQIARNLLNLTEKKGWSNHPAVKMWKGYEPYLIKVYFKAIIDEWVGRGYKNEKISLHYKELYDIVKDRKSIKPPWITKEFCESHQSNLLRKNKEYYSKFFTISDNLSYIWPV